MAESPFLSSLVPPLLPLKIRIGIDIIQHRLSSLRSLHSQLFNPPRLPLRLSGHPPRHTRDNDTSTQNSHSNRKRRRIVRRILGLEDLRAHRAANLAVAVHEANRERGPRGARGGLHAPGPHHWVPRLREGVCNDGRGVDAAVAGEGVQHTVARQNGDEEAEREDRSREPCAVGEVARDGDDHDREARCWDVEELAFRNRSIRGETRGQ